MAAPTTNSVFESISVGGSTESGFDPVRNRACVVRTGSKWIESGLKALVRTHL